VVLLIIGILLAIAIPTFLSTTRTANNTAAQANLQTALTGAKTFYTNEGQTYAYLKGPSATVSTIQQIDTGLSFTSGISSGQHIVSVYVGGGGDYVILTDLAVGTNDCWGIMDLSAAQNTAVQGETGIGTWFFVNLNAGSANCGAQSYSPSGTAMASQVSATGFPHG
jgi:type II secretory pathway pseudopilin PulG